MIENYKYTVDLTRLINERIELKGHIKKLGNEIYTINKEIHNQKSLLTKTENQIDKLVINYNKKKK